MKTEYQNNKTKIFAPLKDRWLEAKPEEIVRQEFICKLINDYRYSLEQMAQEVKLTSSQRGTGRASADLIIWKTEADKKANKTAFLVVELKAENLKLKVEDCYQGYNYATWSRAKLFAVSNGVELQVYKTIEDELPLKLQPVNDIPDAETLLDDAKLKKALEKTKEFTGDEFATLLHKCHNIIRNNDKLSPEASFDEISKILFIKIMYERSADKGRIFSLKEFQRLKDNHNELTKGTNEQGSSFIQKRFEQVKSTYKDDGIFDDNEKIKIRESSFEAIVTELQIYNLTSTSADVKGIAFEKFLGRTFRGELGQFFTPRTIVDFIVDLLEPTENELICDPCAGSGGFLIKVFETVKKQIDDEYVKLKTKKQKEVFGQNLENIDNKDLQEKYENFLTKTNKEQDNRINKLSHKSIFGTDANPRMARVSKMNMIMHGDGHNGIHHNDGLLNINGIFRNRFDVIITNPPFGTTLAKDSPTVEEDDRYTNETTIKKYQKEYGKELYNNEIKQVTDNIGKPIRKLFEVGNTSGATEVLFVERCIDLLKPGGRMGIVLPEGVLNSSNLQKARDFFESKAKILLIVSLPQDVFISSGATVKTSLVFFKKFTEEEQEQYNQVKNKAEVVVNDKYYNDIEKIQEILKPKGKKAKSGDDKKQLRKQLKEIEIKKSEEIKAIIKDKFDHQISIADIKKAGITTTGKQGDNQLPELGKIFAKYRKQNNLW
jgi:type I restriction enzyme M protein